MVKLITYLGPFSNKCAQNNTDEFIFEMIWFLINIAMKQSDLLNQKFISIQSNSFYTYEYEIFNKENWRNHNKCF